MAYIKKPLEITRHSIELGDSVSNLLEEDARFVKCTPGHVATVLKKTLWRDPEYRRWRVRSGFKREPSRKTA